MASSREALFQLNITKAMSYSGWEYVSWLELAHYRLTKRMEECLRPVVAGEDFGLTSVSDVRSAKPHAPEK